jgi:hypothetical protein
MAELARIATHRDDYNARLAVERQHTPQLPSQQAVPMNHQARAHRPTPQSARSEHDGERVPTKEALATLGANPAGDAEFE